MTSPSVPNASVPSPEALAPHPIEGQPPTTPLGLERPALLVVSNGQGDLGAIRRLGQAVAGQAWGLYLREPALSARTLYELAIELTALGLRVLIADRVDVALASGAFGVELGERSLPVARVRAWVGRRLYLGRSVHDLAGARAAASEGADWLLFGQVYASPSKIAGKATGIASLAAVTAHVSIPVLAIGGLQVDRVPEVLAAGASGIAVISAVAGASDPGAAVRELGQALAAWPGERAGGARAQGR
jgi:thiamine-phosphate diphosphorylase